MAEIVWTGEVTGYGSYDNDPPGYDIAYPDAQHSQTRVGNCWGAAYGDGTWEYPLAMAGDINVVAAGTLAYDEVSKRYYILVDYCAACQASNPKRLDLYVGGDLTNGSAIYSGNQTKKQHVNQVASDLTRIPPETAVGRRLILNPNPGYPVPVKGPVSGITSGCGNLGSPRPGGVVVTEIPTNRFGIAAGGDWVNQSTADLNRAFDDIKAMGATRIRLDYNFNSSNRSAAGAALSFAVDKTIDIAVAKGIKPLIQIGGFPSWANNSPTAFGNFCREAVLHFKTKGITEYEIWNEPNLQGFMNPVDPVLYTQCLKDAYPKMKGADPNCFILSAGLSDAPETALPDHMKDFDFLNAIYANGGKGFFDGVAYHAYGFPNLPGVQVDWNGWQRIANTNPSIRSIMVANGDGAKPIWITETGAPTNTNSEAFQAQLIGQEFDLAKQTGFIGPIFVHTYRDLCTTAGDEECWYGLVRNNWSHKPAWDTYKSKASAEIPNGPPPPPPPPPPPGVSMPTLQAVYDELSQLQTSGGATPTADGLRVDLGKLLAVAPPTGGTGGLLPNTDLSASAWSWNRTRSGQSVTATAFTSDATDGGGDILRQATVTVASGKTTFEIKAEFQKAASGGCDWAAIGVKSPSGKIEIHYINLVGAGTSRSDRYDLFAARTVTDKGSGFWEGKVAGTLDQTGTWTVYFGIPNTVGGTVNYRNASFTVA
jgi:hypothetical protein